MRDRIQIRCLWLFALFCAVGRVCLDRSLEAAPAHPGGHRRAIVDRRPVYGPLPIEEIVAVEEPDSCAMPVHAEARPGGRTRFDTGMMGELKLIFISEGVPEELVWIAEIESGLDPSACSPSGAAGLFQLKPATANRFGLRTDRLDERLEPAMCARAAARYLRELYGRFGSWPLVLAAYNAGEGRVEKALASSGERTIEAASRFLPDQTRGYVPRVIALISDREGTHPASLPPPGSHAADSRG